MEMLHFLFTTFTCHLTFLDYKNNFCYGLNQGSPVFSVYDSWQDSNLPPYFPCSFPCFKCLWVVTIYTKWLYLKTFWGRNRSNLKITICETKQFVQIEGAATLCVLAFFPLKSNLPNVSSDLFKRACWGHDLVWHIFHIVPAVKYKLMVQSNFQNKYWHHMFLQTGDYDEELCYLMLNIPISNLILSCDNAVFKVWLSLVTKKKKEWSGKIMLCLKTPTMLENLLMSHPNILLWWPRVEPSAGILF